VDKNPNYLGRESINSEPLDTHGNVLFNYLGRESTNSGHSMEMCPLVCKPKHIITFLGYLSFI